MDNNNGIIYPEQEEEPLDFIPTGLAKEQTWYFLDMPLRGNIHSVQGELLIYSNSYAVVRDGEFVFVCPSRYTVALNEAEYRRWKENSNATLG